MELTGKLINIKGAETITAKAEGAKDFVKREFWIETLDEKFPQSLALELHGDKTTLIDGYSLNQEITVEVNLKGKVSGDRCFNTLQAWRISDYKK